ncbi:DUF2975 domain-containing protein [Ralstonia sp. 24A2]|uniref:DUF2975 domain-containing protein n=1 Tax=Ralstonia sp. 24A2 TaxID=3447364 RepID=UPI003F694F25
MIPMSSVKQKEIIVLQKVYDGIRCCARSHMSQLHSRPDIRAITTSRLLAWACRLLAIALPLLCGYALLDLPAQGWLARINVQPSMPVAVWQMRLAGVLGLLPVGAMAYGLLRASQCLQGFVRGETFALSTVKRLRSFAAAALTSAVLGLVTPSLISLVLTLHAAPGQHAMTLNIGSSDLLMAVVAGVVWQIAAVYTRAIELAEENAQFI